MLVQLCQVLQRVFDLYLTVLAVWVDRFACCAPGLSVPADSWFVVVNAVLHGWCLVQFCQQIGVTPQFLQHQLFLLASYCHGPRLDLRTIVQRGQFHMMIHT